MKYLLFSLAAFFFLCVSCKKNDGYLSSIDYIIFGHFYGECLGEDCIEIFKINNDHLYEDTRDHYPDANDFYNANFQKLSDEKFALTKDIINYFPMSLLDEENHVIGQPDAGDWGGLYIEYKRNSVRKFWLLDKKKENVPSTYHVFIDKVAEVIQAIQ